MQAEAGIEGMQGQLQELQRMVEHASHQRDQAEQQKTQLQAHCDELEARCQVSPCIFMSHSRGWRSFTSDDCGPAARQQSDDIQACKLALA